MRRFICALGVVLDLPTEAKWLCAVIGMAFVLIALLPINNDALDTALWLKVCVALFLISLIIGVVSIVLGVGGSVFVTPVLLAFTSMDTLLVRGCGVVVSLFSGLIVIHTLFRSNILNIPILFYCATPIVLGSLLGSTFAVFVSEHYAQTGDRILRLVLGLIMLGVSVLMYLGKKNNFPTLKAIPPLSKRLELWGSYRRYFDGSLVRYAVSRPAIGFVMLLAIGLMTGFYGIGGGWAMAPVLNVVMNLPIKIAVSTGGALAGLSTAPAFWNYASIGAILPLFAVPLMLGQIVGGIIGSKALLRFRAEYLRAVLVITIGTLGLRLLYVGWQA